MRTKQNQYFEKWWIPVLVYLGIFAIFFIGAKLERNWIINFSGILVIINFLASTITGIRCIKKGKWYFLFPIMGVGLIVVVSTFILFAIGNIDYYGANKKIPENIKIYDPYNFSPKSVKYLNSNSGLRISGYGGSYSFYIKYSFKEKGNFYLKAYEITSNERLSEKKLNKRLYSVNTLEEKLYKGYFKIYEGSQNHQYACRIELWFKPLDDKDEYKVTEQNFKITGWESSW